MSRSISGELSKKIMITVSILMIGGIFGITSYSNRVVKEITQKNAEGALATYIKDIESLVSEVETMESFVSWQMENNNYNPESQAVICEKLKEFSNIVNASFIDFNADSIRLAEMSEGMWGEPRKGRDDSTLVTTYSVTLKNADSVPYAVLSVEASLKAITDRLAREHFYQGSYAALFSPGGAFISHPIPQALGLQIKYVPGYGDDERFMSAVGDMISGGSGIAEISKEKALAIYGPVNNGWSAAMVCPAKVLFGPVMMFDLILLLIAFFDLLVIYLITRTIISRNLLPITEVTYLAKNVAKGNFKAVIPKVKGNNEMYHLHESLRSMLQSINDYISQLKTTTAANQRFESELSIASDIQRQMLCTDFINDEEVDLFATLIPAKEVGGDMYDFLRAGRTIYFAVGDVSGKGVPAALYMAISRSLFHYVSGKSLSTSNIVSCINSSFCSGNENNMFITMFVGSFNLDTRELVFCNAGHNPIVIISPDGKAEFIHAKSNLAAGVYDEFIYEKESMIIEKGSRLLIYTDGVTEAENSNKELYGEDRLIAFANSVSPDIASEEFVNMLVGSVKGFTRDNEQNDDITIMSIKI